MINAKMMRIRWKNTSIMKWICFQSLIFAMILNFHQRDKETSWESSRTRSTWWVAQSVEKSTSPKTTKKTNSFYCIIMKIKNGTSKIFHTIRFPISTIWLAIQLKSSIKILLLLLSGCQGILCRHCINLTPILFSSILRKNNLRKLNVI